MQDELPRSLRLFNIRFRLSVDIRIDFEGKISLTKTKQVRDTYVLIIQLMEAWNAYEALSRYAKEIGGYVMDRVGKSKMYSQKTLKSVQSMELLESVLNQIQSEFNRDKRFRCDFEQYIERLVNEPEIKGVLTQDAKNVLAHLRQEKSISGIEVLSLIYAERNMYNHNGETAKMGMTYSNRKKLLSVYGECLTSHTLRLATQMIENQIAQNL